MDFEYFVSEKNGFIVVSLIGDLSPASVEALTNLREQVSNSMECKRLILNLRDLASVSKDAIPGLAQIQKSARNKQIAIRLCGLKPTIREALDKAGILRAQEISDNLQTAIQSLVNR